MQPGALVVRFDALVPFVMRTSAFLVLTALVHTTRVLAQAPAADCAPPTPGFVTLHTTPWTEVFIDGVLVGTTPLYRHAVAPGPHTITFVNEALGVLSDEDIDVDEGVQHKRKLVFVTDVGTPTLSDDVAAKVGDEDCFVPELQRAELTVNSDPWSRVYLDTKLIGSTPVYRATVAVGDHTLRLVDAHDRVSFARFSATAGEAIKIVVNLTTAKTIAPAAIVTAPLP
jgi:hypothetical protein